MKKTMVALLSSCLMTGVLAATVISPNQNGNSGHIPSGQSDLEFRMAEGNWTENIYLPKNPKHNDRIRIISEAAYDAYLDTSNTNIPIESLKISNGSSYSFIYNNTKQKWVIQSKQISPNNQTNDFNVTISSNITQVHLRDGAHARQIIFPNNAPDGALINISSSATWNSKINTQNLLFPSSYSLKSGDDYWFKFNTELNKWVPISISSKVLYAKEVGSTIQSIDAPITEINFKNGNWIPSIQLPAKAQDRDRVIFKSNAEWSANIKNDNTNTQATLKLRQGDRYEFMYVADQAHWVLMSSPELALKTPTNNTTFVQIPSMEVPTTRYTIESSSNINQINLPNSAQVGDKVILQSAHVNDIRVSDNNGLNKIIKSWEKQRYIYTNSGWVQDTATIDMLMVASKDLSDEIGYEISKIRLFLQLELTNIAAENSNAQLYLRPVGFMNFTIPTKNNTLPEALREAERNSTLLNERNRLRADAVYYETSTKSGCSAAYQNKTPSELRMISVANYACGINTMRRLFAINMGVGIGNEKGIGRGFYHPLGSTITSFNNLPYYSSPNIYHPKYGYRLGEFNQIDAVSIMNKNAPLVAAFY